MHSRKIKANAHVVLPIGRWGGICATLVSGKLPGDGHLRFLIRGFAYHLI
jgi:hypothetical protein